jgi:formate hydrogenlyase subunit 3/multisubunit Na+/H+ antiporter MnhD subunit
MPIGAGFVWRWALFREMAASRPGVVPIFLLAGVGVMVGVWRGLSYLLTRPPSPKDRSVVSEDSSEGWLTAVVVVVAVLACVGVGLFPQMIASLAARLAETYTFFSS